jgi:Outer membrane lipoprotein carrier protein LolA-like
MRVTHSTPRARRRVRTATALLAAVLFCVHAPRSPALAAGDAAPPSDLPALMRLLAQRQHGEVPYSEMDYLELLDHPLKSSGVLIYDAPAHLEKRMLRPRKETVILDHGEMTIERGDRTYHLDLSSQPRLAPYVDAIAATMAGNLGALEQVFKVSFQGTLAHWQLQLLPRDDKVAREVRSIHIAGAEDAVRSVQIDAVNGDRSVMTMGATQGPPPK